MPALRSHRGRCSFQRMRRHQSRMADDIHQEASAAYDIDDDDDYDTEEDVPSIWSLGANRPAYTRPERIEQLSCLINIQARKRSLATQKVCILYILTWPERRVRRNHNVIMHKSAGFLFLRANAAAAADR